MKPLTSIAAVACYLRVSTENQIENYSIDEQRERLKKIPCPKGQGNLLERSIIWPPQKSSRREAIE